MTEAITPIEGQTMIPTQEPLFALEDLTITTESSLSEKKKQIKELGEMIKGVYQRSEAYRQKEELVKLNKQDLQQTKTQLDTHPEVAALQVRKKELQEEVKEAKVAISDYALEYARLAGKETIEKNGVTYDIVKSAKLVKRLQ